MIPGLLYFRDIIDDLEAARLIELIDAQPWLTPLRRRVQHYGYIYDYKARAVNSEMFIGPLPSWLDQPLNAINLMLTSPHKFDQAIVNEYEPGQGISRHIDCLKCFHDGIAILSLGSQCEMEFLFKDEKFVLILQPRSLLYLSGDARYTWAHQIRPRKSDTIDGQRVKRSRRLSLTFRRVIVS